MPAALVGPDKEFTPRKIARWLRMYLDWREELKALPGVSGRDYSRPVVQGGRRSSGPAAQATERHEALKVYVATVETWLSSMSWLERTAAEYWLQDDEGTVTRVANELNLSFRNAEHLVRSIPLLIWGRFYRAAKKSG